MHGRVKVRTSAEEAARKKKEQELKVKAYRAGMAKIIEKRSKNELDEELISITGQILSRNPDVNTLWNIRRECILQLQTNLDDEVKQSLYEKDLGFTEQCLMVNPKCYGAWHHRCWILENCPKPNWEKEVALCTKYLKLDERNFHCWDYRRFVVEKAGIPPEKELDFCTEKIRNNFSNYSSWHYRSKLLPVLFPNEKNPDQPISEEKLKEELEMVLSAAFTDPKDSSAWFYQRWLLGYSQPQLDIAAFRITKNQAVLSFNKSVKIEEFCVRCDLLHDLNDRHWKPATERSLYDHTWIVNFEPNEIELPNGDHIYKLLCHASNDKIYCLELKYFEGGYCGVKCPKFEYEFGAAVIEELKNQLESCNELLTYEPDSKWTLLTASLLMRAVDRNAYYEKSIEYLKQLQEIDFLRKGYYEDLASKWAIEKRLEEWISSNNFPRGIDLSNLAITSVFYEQYFSIADGIDLRKNKLISQSKFVYFLFSKHCDLLHDFPTNQKL